MANIRVLAIVAVVGIAPRSGPSSVARAQQAIGSTTTVQNQVTRELQGGARGHCHRGFGLLNEAVKTGSESFAKLVFLDSTNLSVGPTSRVVLDRFVYVGELERPENGGQSGQRHLPLHDRRAGQEGLHDQHAHSCDRGPRHRAGYKRAQHADPRDAEGRPGDRMPAPRQAALRGTRPGSEKPPSSREWAARTRRA